MEETYGSPWYTQKWVWYTGIGAILVGLYFYQLEKSKKSTNIANGSYTPQSLAQELNYMTTTLNGMQQALTTMQNQGTAASNANNPTVTNIYSQSSPANSTNAFSSAYGASVPFNPAAPVQYASTGINPF